MMSQDNGDGTSNESVFTIPPLGYTFRTQSYVADATCVVAMTSGAPDNSMTLGTYFLASFYAEFDYVNAKIGFSTGANTATWTSTIV